MNALHIATKPRASHELAVGLCWGAVGNSWRRSLCSDGGTVTDCTGPHWAVWNNLGSSRRGLLI